MPDITLEQATEIAQARLAEEPRYRFVLLPDKTKERPFGWVFYYVPRRYLETRSLSDLVPGSGPLIVDRVGASRFLSSSLTPRLAIEEYQRQWLIDHRR